VVSIILILLTESVYLEVVVGVHFVSHVVEFSVVLFLQLFESSRHLALPQLTVLVCCVSAGQCRQLPQLLQAETTQTMRILTLRDDARTVAPMNKLL